MLKRVMLIVSLLLLIPSVFADIAIDYNLDQANVLFDVYSCTGNCNALQLLSSQTVENNPLTYNYPNPGNYLYAAYKECFFPLVNEAPITREVEGFSNDLELTKRSGCSSNIGSAILVQGTENKTISTQIYSPFIRADFSRPILLDNLPEGRAIFFNTLVSIRLYVNNILLEEKNESFFISESKQISFNWSQPAPGDYTLKIVTLVPDCKCSSSQQYEKSIRVTISQTTNQAIINQVPEVQNTQSTPVFQPVVNQPVQNTPIIQEPQNKKIIITSTATCQEDGGCKLGCEEGDNDCSCSGQSGFLCKEDDQCKEKWLKNWGNKLCCSNKCTESSLINASALIDIFSRNKIINQEENRSKEEAPKEKSNLIRDARSYNFSFLFFIFFVCTIIGILFSSHQREIITNLVKEEVEILEEEGKKGVDFLKKEEQIIEEFFKKKPKPIQTKKVQSLTPLLVNIMESLNNDENRIIMKLVETEGISKTDLISKLGYTKEKVDFCLIKLSRRQIIEVKGEYDNPKIYICDWLK